nr:FAD-dependent monooxygenase StrN [Stachybotrys sp.]
MSTQTSQQRPLKIVIVGGGIAGLTLANALQHAPADIEYLVLEARDSLVPHLGAGIALVPNGSRILDQLGVYADLEPGFDPIADSSVLDARGRPLLPERTDMAKLLGVRMSYPLALVQRRTLLQSLAKHLNSSKGQVLTGKKVQKVEQDESGATVHCSDGTSYHGDIVVGADGVHSKVREEMWRTATNINADKERRAMTAEYKCLFGISNPVPGLGPGTSDDTWDKDLTVVVYSGEMGKLFWFVYARMDRVYQAHEIPRYSADDAVEFALKQLDVPLRPGGTVKFADVWSAREVATMLPLEEAHFPHWTFGRIVCLGDSVHKMTPHTGAGGMLGMETAAALANTLCRLATETRAGVQPANASNGYTSGKKPSATPSLAQIKAALHQYEYGSPNNLHTRAEENVNASGMLGRLSALHTLAERILVPYLAPLSAESRIDMFCDMAVGAPHIEYLPIPPRSMEGTMPFNPSHGFGKKESPWLRAFIALPLFMLAVVSFVVIVGLVPFDLIKDALEKGVYRPTNGDVPVQLVSELYKVPFIDDFSRVGSIEFLISGQNCFLQMLNFYADYGIWYAITMIESARRANHLSILTPIVLWGMLNMRGIALFGAVWKFFHYILSPVSNFAALDKRLTDKTYTNLVLPIILATHYATYLGALVAPDTADRQKAGHLWALFPIWISLGQFLLVRFVLKPSTVNQDRLYNITSDMAAIRRTVVVLVALSAAAWQYTVWRSARPSFIDIFLPDLPIRHVSEFSIEAAYVEFLKWDTVFFALGNATWIALLFWDLKAAGMIRSGWLTLLSYGIGLALVGGPGTFLGLAWLYREEILVKNRHKDAVVPRSL